MGSQWAIGAHIVHGTTLDNISVTDQETTQLPGVAFGPPSINFDQGPVKFVATWGVTRGIPPGRSGG